MVVASTKGEVRKKIRIICRKGRFDPIGPVRQSTETKKVETPVSLSVSPFVNPL